MVYDVHLEIFEGPLDLLLYLIKKDDLEIAEIPIAQITTEYLSYLELMKELNLDIAGDFLVMAATLMQIKARMLLPSAEAEEDEGPDPLEELKARLMEYQKYKEVAQLLGHKEIEYAHVYYRPAPAFEKGDYTLEATLFELMEGFRSVLKELPKDVKEIVYKEIPIEIKIREILDLFETKEHLSFRDILRLQPNRHSLIVSFLAILELIRLKQIVAKQNELFDEIRIYRMNDTGEQDNAIPAPGAQGAEALKGTELYAAQDAVTESAMSESPAELPVTETPAPEEPVIEELPVMEAPVPEILVPETPALESPMPEVPAPETQVMEVSIPEAFAPETAVPEMPVPEAPALQEPAPEVQMPEALAPEAPIEENTTGPVPEDQQ